MASAIEEVVDFFQFGGEEFVVVAELEELRVGILQELDSSFGAGGAVVNEGGVPSDHGEIVRIVGNAGLQNFLAFAVGERLGLAPHDLRDEAASRNKKIVGRG